MGPHGTFSARPAFKTLSRDSSTFCPEGGALILYEFPLKVCVSGPKIHSCGSRDFSLSLGVVLSFREH